LEPTFVLVEKIAMKRIRIDCEGHDYIAKENAYANYYHLFLEKEL